MVGGTIRRKLIHRERFRASVLHHSENQAVLQSIAEKKCLLTTPSLLSSATRHGHRILRVNSTGKTSFLVEQSGRSYAGEAPWGGYKLATCRVWACDFLGKSL